MIKHIYREFIHISTAALVHKTHSGNCRKMANITSCTQHIHRFLWIKERLFLTGTSARIRKKKGRDDDVKLLNDESLIETYYKALELELEEEFIKLLEKEMERRQLEPYLPVS